ncbi:helix-turn-helix transcriptional regulator [Pedobacter sp. Du54]|uniref:helix-turn-helix domain-containing protein n=1 Tax=Pedobacter anseongensis TaxID=3133439 RepID=UPI0030B2BDD8
MKSIPGIEKLNDLLTQVELEKLLKAAGRQAQTSNMSFTILSVTGNEIQIEVAQGETKSGKYATEATLTSRTKELFNKFIPKLPLNISPVPFAPSPASTVNPEWLESKMQQKGLRIKQIAFDTGVNRESISDWVTGKRTMSQIVKAMFYFYFK